MGKKNHSSHAQCMFFQYYYLGGERGVVVVLQFLASWREVWHGSTVPHSIFYSPPAKYRLILFSLCRRILPLYPLVLIIHTFLVVYHMLPVLWKFISENFPAYSSVGNNVIAHGHDSHRALRLPRISSQKWQGAARPLSYCLLRSNDIPLTAPAVITPTNLPFSPHSLLPISACQIITPVKPPAANPTVCRI